MTETPEEKQAPEEYDALATKLIGHASRILDPQMRRVYFSGKIKELSDEACIEVLNRLVQAAAMRKEDAVAVLSSLGEGDDLEQALGRMRVSRIYHGANRLGYRDVVRLLARPRAAKEYGQEDDTASLYAIKGRTLGERRYMARSSDRDLLDRLTYDLDPLVIRELLGNPLIVERHVIKIAARRPTTPELLSEVAQHPRWSARMRVREAVVRNPYVDTRLALSLVSTLLVPHLRQIAGDTEVHEEVRQQARGLLDQRGNRKGDGGEQVKNEK